MSDDPQPQPQLAERSAILREELKAWEKLFAANCGRKAGRDDIKKDRSIASKYKEYSKLRGQLSNKHSSPSESGPSTEPGPSSTTDERRNVALQHTHTHTPRRLPPSTPSRDIHPADLDPYDSPLSARKLLFANESRTCIGPTPQRNGKVLGLFDLLEEDKANSPLKTRRSVLLDGSSNVQVTPRKGGRSGGSTPVARTPASSAKRRLYEVFNTPLKRQKLGDGYGSGPVSDAQFATPPFLRRDRQGTTIFSTVGEDGEPTPASPVVRMPAKPPVRGLSTILARLRQMEEEALDDEMDVLREIEREGPGQPTIPPPSIAKSAPTLTEGGQLMPSGETPANANGPEAIGGSDNDADEKPTLGRDGKPLKVWKKKGQKRTTRRTILRPVRVKPKPTPESVIDDSEADGDEMQATPTTNTASTSGKGVTHDGDEPDSTNNVPARTGDGDSSNKGASTKESLTRRAAKKISSQAHPNFRRLKLRNKNSKGKRNGGRMGSKRRR